LYNAQTMLHTGSIAGALYHKL